MAAKEYTAQQWAQLLAEKIGRSYPVEMKAVENGPVRMDIRFAKGAPAIAPIELPRGDFYALVYADGGVEVRYELCVAYDAQYSYELLILLNRINALPGATYSISGSEWTGTMLLARDEFQIERFQGAFADRVGNRMLRAAADVRDVLRDLEIQMPGFFSPEELDRAKAEANLSPEELLRLPEVCQAPPEAGTEYPAEEFFDGQTEGQTMPEWYDEWGDEQEFLEKFINEPVEKMSGSELIMLDIALRRDTIRLTKKFEEKMASIQGADKE